VQALDADGYTIVGSGAPAIAVNAASPTVQVTAAAPGTFAIAATVSGGVVTPGTIPLTLVATPVGSPALPFLDNVALTISHTAVFVSATTNVFVYLDGNTTSPVTLTMTNNPRGVAVDATGNAYVANHGNNTISECTAAGNYATCTVPINAGLNGPEGVAIDGAGNLWEGDSVGGNINEFLAGALSLGVVIPSGFGTLRGVAVDTNGNLWASDQDPVVRYHDADRAECGWFR
jgi:streptogramin lyase